MTDHRPDMHTDEARHDRPELGYETTDAQAKPLAFAFVGLSVLIILAFVGMWLLFVFFDSRAQRTDQPPDTRLSNYKPPGPRLQVYPKRDLADYLKREHDLMNSYGWLNKASGIVRMPVARAMDIVLQKGLPTLPPLGLPAGTQNPFATGALKTPNASGIAAGTDSSQPAAPGGGPPGRQPENAGRGSQGPTPTRQK